MTQWSFRGLVSGESRGILPCATRPVLHVMSLPYRLAVAARNRAYDTHRLPIDHAGLPVISVGNLTLGGTGKTPCVIWLSRWLQAEGLRPAILSRGYGADRDGWNDEAREIAQCLPDVHHWVGKNRSASAQRAVQDGQCDVLVLDDGFQHRRLYRNLDLVLIDALCPWGYDRIFPHGMLREPLTALRRASAICLTRADAVTPQRRHAIRQRIVTLAGNKPWFTMCHHPTGWLRADGKRERTDLLAGRRVAAFCAIGNPNAFRHTLQDVGCEIVTWREFPDHHRYLPRDLDQIGDTSRSHGRVDAIVCTRKDLVKIDRTLLGDLPLWGLEVAGKVDEGLAAFESLVRLTVTGRGDTTPRAVA